MRFFTVALFALGFGVASAADNIVGFNAAGSAEQRALESVLDSTIDATEMDGWLKRLSERPHHVGSLASKENAEFMAALLESWGYDVEIADYQILLPTPRVREVELVAPVQYTAGLTEDTIPGDPSTAMMTAKPTAPVNRRFPNSISAWYSSDATNWSSSQVGQSVQPSPEPVRRTEAPVRTIAALSHSAHCAIRT